MTTHVVKLIAFKNDARTVTEETPHMLTFELDTLPEEFLTFKNCWYEGLISHIPQESHVQLLELLEKISTVNLDTFFGDYTTICMVVNNTVLSFDMLGNSDCYAEHPLMELGKAYTIRDKLELLFADKKLSYLTQSLEWYQKRENYHKKNIEQTQQIQVQLELMRLLNKK